MINKDQRPLLLVGHFILAPISLLSSTFCNLNETKLMLLVRPYLNNFYFNCHHNIAEIFLKVASINLFQLFNQRTSGTEIRFVQYCYFIVRTKEKIILFWLSTFYLNKRQSNSLLLLNQAKRVETNMDLNIQIQIYKCSSYNN
jgi:hypothetical protein